MKVTDATISH